MIITIAVSLSVGAVATSIAEYKFQYNLVDKVIDLFHTAEGKAQRAEARAEQAADKAKAFAQTAYRKL